MQVYVIFAGLCFLVGAPIGVPLVQKAFEIEPLKGLWYRKAMVVLVVQGILILIQMFLAYAAWRGGIPIDLQWLGMVITMILWVAMGAVLQMIFWPVAKTALHYWEKWTYQGPTVLEL